MLFDLDRAFDVDTNSIRRWLDPSGMGTNKYTDTTLLIGCMKNLEQSEKSMENYNKKLSALAKYAKERPAKLLGYFQEALEMSDADMEKYFGAAIQKIRES